MSLASTVVQNISASKKRKPNLKGRKEMRLFAIDKVTGRRFGPFKYVHDAISELKLPTHAGSNIGLVLRRKWKYAYGHEWVDELSIQDWTAVKGEV